MTPETLSDTLAYVWLYAHVQRAFDDDMPPPCVPVLPPVHVGER